ncbi:MAG: PRD domain-containing protein [Clostridium sp.]
METEILKRTEKPDCALLIHVSCMAERIIQDNIYEQADRTFKDGMGVVGIVKDALRELESLIGVEVPESECAYLIELLTE